MAHIIPFPNSATAPVQQRRGPGRHPRMVVQLWKWRSKKNSAMSTHSASQSPSDPLGLFKQRTPAEELAYAARMFNTFTELRAEALLLLHNAQRRLNIPVHSSATLYPFPTTHTGAQHV